jgi:predicted DNA-binding transcriptional regulator AlpA
VAARFGYTAPGLLAAARAGRFPQPVRLSPKRCAWWLSQLEDFAAALKGGGGGDAA